MSQKALKRKIRRGTDDSDTDFKLPAHYTKKESLNTSDDGVKTRKNQNGSGSNNESDSDDNIALKNFVNTEDNGKSDSPSPRSRSTTPKSNKSKDTEQEQSDEQKSEKEDYTNGKEHGTENGNAEESKNDDENNKTIEMEPLLLEFEETEPELMFTEEESGSEMNYSDKGSPILSRSVTRRSHTRNIPTPKTPKSVLELNGPADVEQCANMQPAIPLVRIPDTETPDGVAEEGEQEESSQASTMDSNSESAATATVEEQQQQQSPAEIEVEDTQQQQPPPPLAVEQQQLQHDLTIDSCASANEEDSDSLLVNVTGDDATRNIEFSCKDPSLLDESTDSYRNRSCRSLSSRRSIRPNAEDVYRRKAFHNAKDDATRNSAERNAAGTAGLKRKQRSTTPDSPKRYKLEPDPERSPGLLSYISSPIIHIRNRLSRTQLPSSSTPILKGYKPNPLLGSAEENPSKHQAETADGTHVIPEKKWCAIM